MPGWTHRVLLNGADITARTLLGAQIEEAENVSAVCDLTYYPADGLQDSDGLILQTLVVDADVGAGWQRLFTGRVIRALWETTERYYSIRGSNRMQEHFRALGSEAGVLTALPGAVYSEALFGEAPDDLWPYAERCFETLQQDIHLDRSGVLEIIDWPAKATPDQAFTAETIHHDGPFELSRPDGDELINEVVIEYAYRVQRWKVRDHTITWSAWTNNVGIASWCEWAIGVETRYSFPMPMLPWVEDVLLGGSWNVPSGVRYDTHPPSGTGYCTTDWVWINPEQEHGEIAATSAGATGYRAWSQTITETYTLTVSAAAAQAYYGTTVTDRKTGSRDIAADEAWPPVAALPQSGWDTDAIGDSYEDQEDETLRANDLQAGWQWAGWRIRGAQRATTLKFRVDLLPAVTLADTVSVDAYDNEYEGKITGLIYVLNAAPYTELTIAISRGNGGSDDTWSVPARPDTTDPGYTAPDSLTSLSTYAGGWTGAAAAPDPDERQGWITNVIGTAYNPAAPQYSSAFRAEWPAIEDEAAEEIEADVAVDIEISVPHDTLVTQ